MNISLDGTGKSVNSTGYDLFLVAIEFLLHSVHS